ncbi:MAG: A24 family peptidase [Fimbriiglobus sp.]|jgi:Flp pilus assembly protein protease CpaA|nr:A24 family peptidase [Fimbriiglobus sp.]
MSAVSPPTGESETGSPVAQKPDDGPLPYGRRYWLSALLAPVPLLPLWVVLARAVGAPLRLAAAAVGLLVLLLAVVVVTDLRVRRIPNWATYTAAGWAVTLLLLSAVAGHWAIPGVADADGIPTTLAMVIGIPPFTAALAGFAAGFVPMLAFYALFGGGAGDVKLVAAIGLLVGFPAVFQVLLYTFLVAGAFALVYLVWKVGPGGMLAGLGSRLFPGRVRPPETTVGETVRAKVPMAPFIAAGVILAAMLTD